MALKQPLTSKTKGHSRQDCVSNIIMAAGICSYTGCLFTSVYKHSSVALLLHIEVEALYFLIFLNTVSTIVLNDTV